MCGINGVLSLDGVGPVAESVLRQMTAAQRHRGPDDEGYLSEPGVGLGFCRLAIIDLSSAGNQPMPNEDETIWLVFNGEIYNFRELIPELEQAGHRFRSRSDGEVIVHAYEEWGIDCLQRFNGMFAFAIWDRKRRRVILARDRLGVKPLYYWSDGREFAFASELKSLLRFPAVQRRLDVDALHAYFVFEYIPSPATIFESVRKLPAGHWLEIRVDGTAQGLTTTGWKPQQYWEVQFRPDWSRPRSVDDYADELRTLLRAAVKRRLISDVPLGAFLSGGIDSSSIVALMAEVSPTPPKTFSIGFREASFSELRFAKLVSDRFHTDHQVEILRPDAQALIQTVADFLDEPFADASALPTYLVSQAARHHVTVALAGDGGDELFAGYEWYRAQRLAAATFDHLPGGVQDPLESLAGRLAPTDRKKGVRDLARAFLLGASRPAEWQHVRWQTFWRNGDLARMFVDGSPGPDASEEQLVQLFGQAGSSHALDQQQYADIKRYLPDDILFKVDRMSMAVSLETRGPFLDYTLVEFAARLPESLRLRGLSTKYILKRAMSGILPDEILHRAKLGFNIPYKNWLRRELRPLLEEVLSPEAIKAQGLFQPRFVSRLMDQYFAGKQDHHHQLWQLLMFQLWAARYLRPERMPKALVGASSAAGIPDDSKVLSLWRDGRPGPLETAS